MRLIGIALITIIFLILLGLTYEMHVAIFIHFSFFIC